MKRYGELLSVALVVIGAVALVIAFCFDMTRGNVLLLSALAVVIVGVVLYVRALKKTGGY